MIYISYTVLLGLHLYGCIGEHLTILDEVATTLRHRISGHPRTISHLPSVKHVINKRGHHVGEVEAAAAV